MPTTEFPYRIQKNRDNLLPWMVDQNLDRLREVHDKLQKDFDTLQSSLGSGTPNLWSSNTKTSDTSITATSEAAATNILSSTSRTFDANPVLVTFFTPRLEVSGTDPWTATVCLQLVRDSTLIGARWSSSSYALSGGDDDDQNFPQLLMAVDTPGAGSHQYHAKGFILGSTGTVTVNVKGGSGGSGAVAPCVLRVARDILIP